MNAEIENRTMRRVTWRIVPFVMLLYFVAFLDRVNVGFAAIHMDHDIGLSSACFGVGAGLFFIGYFLFEVPSSLCLHRFGARLWIARIMLSWGVISGFMVYVKSDTGFWLLRFLLGVAEAGFFPGIILYLGQWFPARRRAAMTALFMASAPISVAIGSPLSGALLQLDGLLGLHGWQWMFLTESLSASILGITVLAYLTDRPERARWLKADERVWLSDVMAREHHETAKAGRGAGIWAGLSDPRVLALAFVYFGTSAGLYTLGIWAPQMLHSLGLTIFQTGLVNAIPAILAVGGMYYWARRSDRLNERPMHVVIACLLAVLGLICAAFASCLALVVLALALVNIGISSAKPPLWSMPTLFLAGPAAASGVAAINSIGNLGGFVGPSVIGYLLQQTGSYRAGLLCIAVLVLGSALMTLFIAGKWTSSSAAGRPSKEVIEYR